MHCTLSSSGAISPCTSLEFLPATTLNPNEDFLCSAFGPWVVISHIEHGACHHEQRQHCCEIQKSGYRFLGFGTKSNRHQHAIHGFNFLKCEKEESNDDNSDRIILGIYGGRQIVFHELCLSPFDCSPTTSKSKLLNETNALAVSSSRISSIYLMPDWIHDLTIAWSSTNVIQAIVGMAHNVIDFWRLPLSKRKSELNSLNQPVRIHRAFCDVRCISYSMALSNLMSPERVNTKISAAVGTVSNEILVWTTSCRKTQDERLKLSAMQVSSEHKLVGHDGPITKLCWSKCNTLLCSSSEDRSVRLWQLNGVAHCQWIGWGHTARIWGIKFSIDEKSVISSGEDGCVRIWNANDGSLIDIISSHTSSIWKVVQHSNYPIIVAGGNDGSAKLWITPELQHPNSSSYLMDTGKSYKIPLDTIFHPKVVKDNVSKQSQVLCGLEVLLASDQPSVLIATRAGSLFSFDIKSFTWKTHRRWKDNPPATSAVIQQPFIGECVATYEPYKVTAIGCSAGEIVLSPLSQVINEPVHFVSDKKLRGVKGIKWIPSKNYVNLLASHIRGNISVFGFARESLDSYGLKGLTCGPIPKYHRVLQMFTVGVCISISYDLLHGALFVGDTRGNMCYFDNPFDQGISENMSASDKIEKAHDREHITSISQPAKSRLYSVGVNGCIVEYNIDHKMGKLRKLLEYPVQNFASLSHIWFQKEKKRLTVGGFYGNQFKIFDLSSKSLVMSIPCLGRTQRLFDVTLWPQAVVFASKEKSGIHKLHLYCNAFDSKAKISSLCSRRIVGQLSHGDSTYAVCIMSSSIKKGRVFIITGSNDCTINHIAYDVANGTLDICSDSASLPRHESCIRALCRSSSIGNPTQLLVCAGGKLNLTFYAFTEDEDGSYFSFHASLKENRVTDIDQRINDVSSIAIELTDHLVVAGDSDGSLYALVLDLSQKYFQPLKAHICCSGLNQRPILCIKLLAVFNTYVAVVGNTAGEVCVWQISIDRKSCGEEYVIISQTLSSYSAHQIGTNGIDALCTKTEVTDEGSCSAEILIASCGDDQAISIGCLKLKIESQTQFVVTEMNLIKRNMSSSSALKSVQIVKKNSAHYNIFLVGYDQQLMIWDYEHENIGDAKNKQEKLKGGVLNHLVSIPTEISDISSLDCQQLDDENMVICSVVGQGMQTILIKPTSYIT